MGWQDSVVRWQNCQWPSGVTAPNMVDMFPMHMAKDLAEQHAIDLQGLGSAGRPYGKSARIGRRLGRTRRRLFHDRVARRNFTWLGRRRLAAATEGRPCPG